MRTIAQETAFQIVLRNCVQAVEGKVSVIHGFIKGGTCSQARVLAEACCCSQGTDVIIDDFSVFLDMERCKNWAHKIFSPKYLTI